MQAGLSTGGNSLVGVHHIAEAVEVMICGNSGGSTITSHSDFYSQNQKEYIYTHTLTFVAFAHLRVSHTFVGVAHSRVWHTFVVFARGCSSKLSQQSTAALLVAGTVETQSGKISYCGWAQDILHEGLLLYLSMGRRGPELATVSLDLWHHAMSWGAVPPCRSSTTKTQGKRPSTNGSLWQIQKKDYLQ